MGMPQIHTHRKFIQTGLEEAEIGVFHFDRDGHFGGRKAGAKMFMELPGNVLATEIDCCSHQLNLASNSMMEVQSNTLVTWAYTCCLF